MAAMRGLLHPESPTESLMPPHRSLVIEPSVLYFGTPVALVSTLNPDGTTNLSPMSSAWSLGDRLVLGFGTRGRAYENLVRHAECVVNLPSAALVAHVERLAPTTGVAPVPEAKAAMGYRHEADKFSVAGLTPAPSHDVAPERVADCPLQIEARVLDVRPLTVVPGEPDPHAAAVEVQAVRVHAHESIVIASTDHVDQRQWHPLLYVWRHYYTTGPAEVGRTFRDRTPPVESPSVASP